MVAWSQASKARGRRQQQREEGGGEEEEEATMQGNSRISA
jgi:hypothetical protein